MLHWRSLHGRAVGPQALIVRAEWAGGKQSANMLATRPSEARHAMPGKIGSGLEQ
jgi:hypothetical protein